MEINGDVVDLPIGWRFQPTDEELLCSYLAKKVGCGPLPAQVIKEIDATEFFSKHPWDLVDSLSKEENIETEWYFFIHGAGYLHGKMKKNRRVGDENGIGYWRSIGKEDPIYDGDGNVYATKIYSTYFLAKPNGTDDESETDLVTARVTARGENVLRQKNTLLRKQDRDIRDDLVTAENVLRLKNTLLREQVRDTNELRQLKKLKKTHWKMEELRLLNFQPTREDDENLHEEEWVVARITRGNDERL
ncbi:hypothetical protein DH2020_019512 [Rehmannia glutinosa]|uniref:NAC domain-containing protein n=1 Tax=Rehmannia glutinosa TaxID=99300 RepID=A0ABR0WR04_REHGL